ncbi:TIGR04013 family B12-binding domain/radical SAM domain-containing protein [Kaarinaea lacus]
MTSSNIAIVFYYRKTGKYAMNVLAGALDSRAATCDIPLYFPKSHQDLINTCETLQSQVDKVVVLWSFYSPDFNKIRREFQGIKKYLASEGILHIAGGVHATAEPLQTLNTGFDYAALGEGEQIVVDMAVALINHQPLSKVKGLAHLRQGILVKNGKGDYIDLDDFPACAPRYRKFGPIEVTRGCVYGCKFCQTPFVNKAKFRHRSVDNIITAVTAMKANGMRDYRFISPTSLSYGSYDQSVNLLAIETLLRAIRKTVGKEGRIFFGSFPSEVRPEHVNKESLALLKHYVDNDNLIIGGQSGSDHVLQMSRRGHDVQSIVNAVDLAVKAGFIPNVDFLFGLPGETPVDVKATMKLAEKLTAMGAKIHNHTFMPLPGTPFSQQAPGDIDKTTQRQLVLLTSQGKAYGQWEKQMEIAKQLAKRSTSYSEQD